MYSKQNLMHSTALLSICTIVAACVVFHVSIHTLLHVFLLQHNDAPPAAYLQVTALLLQ